ncbi:unnamed protein product, partial [Polarella glacialis]
ANGAVIKADAICASSCQGQGLPPPAAHRGFFFSSHSSTTSLPIPCSRSSHSWRNLEPATRVAAAELRILSCCNKAVNCHLVPATRSFQHRIFLSSSRSSSSSCVPLNITSSSCAPACSRAAVGHPKHTSTQKLNLWSVSKRRPSAATEAVQQFLKLDILHGQYFAKLGSHPQHLAPLSQPRAAAAATSLDAASPQILSQNSHARCKLSSSSSLLEESLVDGADRRPRRWAPLCERVHPQLPSSWLRPSKDFSLACCKSGGVRPSLPVKADNNTRQTQLAKHSAPAETDPKLTLPYTMLLSKTPIPCKCLVLVAGVANCQQQPSFFGKCMPVASPLLIFSKPISRFSEPLVRAVKSAKPRAPSRRDVLALTAARVLTQGATAVLEHDSALHSLPLSCAGRLGGRSASSRFVRTQPCAEVWSHCLQGVSLSASPLAILSSWQGSFQE